MKYPPLTFNTMQTIATPSQQAVFDLIGTLLTQQLSEDGHQAVQRLCQSAVYLESDSNIAKIEVEKAIKAIRWHNVMEMYFPNIPSSKREKVIAALKAESQAQIKYWKNIDNFITHLSSMPNVKIENITGLDDIYNQPLYDTNVNSAILGIIQLQCPEMPAVQKRCFAKQIEITIERQNAIKG